MRVAELIEKLKLLPQDALVVTEGYETGYEAVKKVELINVIGNHSHEWWDGEYEKSEGPDTLEVVFLDSGTKNINK